MKTMCPPGYHHNASVRFEHSVSRVLLSSKFASATLSQCYLNFGTLLSSVASLTLSL